MNGRKYKHYHALGIYNIPMMLPLIKLANMKGFKSLLTSDASTALMSANNKMYHKQASQYSPPRRLRLGDIATKPTPYNTFACPCPVCSALKYVDILSVLDGALYRHILHFHNLWEIMRYSRMMDDMAKALDHKDFKEMCRMQLGNSALKNTSLTTLEFIRHVEEEGLKAARRTYGAYLVRNNMWDATVRKSLFDDPKDAVEHGGGVVAHVDFVTKTLAKYERQDHSEEGDKKKKGRKRQKTASRFSKKTKVGKQKRKGTKKVKKSLKMLDAEARARQGVAA